jgi:hypothetical protein
MATPTATATLNKPNFAVGETMVLTVNHADADRQTLTIAGTVTGSDGLVANWSTTATIDAGVVAFTSTGGKTWTLQPGSTLTQSVFTAVA